MKQKDVLLIILIVFFSAMVSYIISNMLFASPKSRKLEVEIVDPINTTFERPDQKYFNNQSLNPTKQITIGDQPNTAPFNNTAPGR